ncbi:MAG: arylsulfatase A-like enzyme [Planctomycetota bacterium]|jgi:arylsulfatase A-like enzyme
MRPNSILSIRASWLVSLFLTGVLCGSSVSAQTGTGSEEQGTVGARPNILLLYSDDHASAAVSAYGSDLPETPNIDRLATQGMRFDNAFCTNAICGPARAVVLTGKHSHINGFIDNNNSVFNGDQQTFPKLLQKAGYETAIIGKWHLHSTPQGFDYWDILPGQGRYYSPEFINQDGKYKLPGYNTDIIASKAIDWLKARAEAKRPFMLMCQFKAPHRAWQASPAEVGLFDDMQMPEPATLLDNAQGLASPAREQEMSISKHMWLYYDLKVPPLEGETLTGPDRWAVGREKHMTAEELAAWNAAYEPRNAAFRAADLKGEDLVRWKYQRYIKDYLRCIQGIDRNVGRILDALDATGLADNTVVVYTSDQGFFLGEHGWYDKRFMYEPSLKVPLLVRWPGVVQNGADRSDLVQNLDFAPTFLDLAGAEVPDDMQGESILPMLRGDETPQWRKGIYYEYSGEATHNVAAHYGIRTREWKLIHYPRTDEWELLDLVNDPEEIQNLYGDATHAQLVATLKSQLIELRRQYEVIAPRAELQVPEIFSDGMVLQRNSSVAVWGTAEPGSRIQISTDWGTGAAATTLENGTWSVDVSIGDAGGPFSFQVTEGQNSITFSDVLLGEVWLCGGQSNMERSVGPVHGNGIDHWQSELQNATFPEIRLFDVPHRASSTPQTDVQATWLRATPESVNSFSAVGFLFGRRLHKDLSVPIGLISCNWGGTPAEAWMGTDAIRRFGDFEAQLKRLLQAEGTRTAKQHRKTWWGNLNRKNSDPPTAQHASQLPGIWTGELAKFDGVVWYERLVEIPADWQGQELTLELGPIDDNDTTWFGETQVGASHGSGAWNQSRSYPVPASAVKSGSTLLRVRVVDTGGAGGFSGRPEQMRLRRNDGSGAIALAGSWQRSTGSSMAELGAIPTAGWPNQHVPTALSNGMLSPILPYGIRGAIWYQGESNASRAIQYRTLFPALIEDWRARWGRGNFPFYFVQIAPYESGPSSQGGALRDAQRRALALPNTGMAITMDIGDARDIHPTNKQDVATRLALWALSDTYQMEVPSVCGPLFRKVTVVSQNSLRVHFEHAKGLTTSDSKTPSHLEMQDTNGVWHPAKGAIENETLLVTCEAIEQATGVRYAWASAAEPNLVNATALPASTFTSE